MVLAGLAILVARPDAATPLGASAFAGLTVIPALVGALVLDQMGRLGFAQQSVGVARIAGAAPMIAGAALVCAF